METAADLMPLVVAIARGERHRTRSPLDFEDIEAEGAYGLAQANAAYTGKPEMFREYAKVRIRFAIRDFIFADINDKIVELSDGRIEERIVEGDFTKMVEARLDIEYALDHLNEKHAKVIRLYHLEGYTVPMMAKILGISDQATRTLLQRAECAMKNVLRGDYDDQ